MLYFAIYEVGLPYLKANAITLVTMYSVPLLPNEKFVYNGTKL
jgi:hypothetical protein